MNNVSFSQSSIINIEPIEQNINGIYANKKVKCGGELDITRSYEKSWKVWSEFFAFLQIFVYDLSNS